MESILTAQQHGVFSDLELAFVRFIARVQPDAGEGLLLAAALAVRATRQGNVCVDLHAMAGSELFRDGDSGSVSLPELAVWLRELQESAVVGGPGEFCPLVLDGTRLYLHRYWQYEQDLAKGLQGLGRGLVAVDNDRLGQVLTQLFPATEEGVIDCQRLAATVAAMRKLCIISGGPGTGKTFTVVKLLALLQELAAPDTLRIGLVAPTGKAAGRLQESIRAAKGKLVLAPELLARIPENSATIHRLLGARLGSPSFRHNRQNPLPLDLLVVDEASMVDLALMAKLVDALPKNARLVLLGDKDQLASVEAGSVLGDICSGKEANGFGGEFAAQLAQGGFAGPAAGKGGPLADSIVLLEKSYRFAEAGSIGKLAQAVNRGDTEAAAAILRDIDHGDLALHGWQDAGSLTQLGATARAGFAAYLTATNPQEALDAFNRFRILCAHRRGRFGVAGMNDWVEGVLAEAGLINRDAFWYRGRPVMITRNHPVLHLYNGDIGITMADETGRLRVFFAGADGSLRSFAPARIPEHETAFAVTVHKSQGSEFESVALLLPEKPSPVLSRELIYTAITRAKESFSLWGDEAVLRIAIGQRVSRASGLQELLWGE
ncbi:MAG: exodeoxyribonuclease V subunit alpha [Desulfobulbaceae bacterium]|nr:exodeoxyribonuclease V subunit alpha [Desulfobulbaceae bacterium]